MLWKCTYIIYCEPYLQVLVLEKRCQVRVSQMWTTTSYCARTRACSTPPASTGRTIRTPAVSCLGRRSGPPSRRCSRLVNFLCHGFASGLLPLHQTGSKTSQKKLSLKFFFFDYCNSFYRFYSTIFKLKIV